MVMNIGEEILKENDEAFEFLPRLEKNKEIV